MGFGIAHFGWRGLKPIKLEYFCLKICLQVAATWELERWQDGTSKRGGTNKVLVRCSAESV